MVINSLNYKVMALSKIQNNANFEMCKGLRLISPEDQEVIATVCRSHGWNGPLVYDGEQEEHS